MLKRVSVGLVCLLVFVSIIQYPYYLFERYDGSITIYQYDYYGNLIPLVHYPNLGALVYDIWY